jgi:hypothetical protein
MIVNDKRVSSIGLRDVQASVLLNIIFIYRGSGHFSTDANKQFFCEVVSCRLLSKSHWSMISTASLCSNVREDIISPLAKIYKFSELLFERTATARK